MMVDVTDGGVEPFTPADDSRAMAISADGTTVAIGRDDGTLEIVDRESGVMTASVLAHAAGGIDGTQLDPAATPDDFDFEGVDQLVFDPSGEKVSSAAAVFLRSWNVDDLSPAGPEIVNAWGEDDFNLVAARPATFWHDKAEPDVLVVAGDSFVVRWRMSTGQRVSLDAVGASLVGAASAGDGSILLLADDGRVVRRALDGVGTGESFTSGADFVFDTQERVVSELTVNDDRSRLAVATDDGVVTAALDGSRIAARAVPIGSSDNPTLTRDGTTLAAGLASDGLFDLTVEPPAQRWFDVHVEIAESAGSPANFELTAAGDDDVLVWTSTFMDMRNAYDLESGDYLGDLWGPYVPAWTDDGRRIARRARAGGTVVTEANSDRDGYSNQRPMTSGDFDAAGGHLILVFADGAPAVVIDLESGDERPLPDMPGGIVSAAFTPDDDQIVAQGASGALWVIDARTLQRVYELEEGDVAKGPVIAPPVISADGTMLFSAADGAARLWHLPSGRQIGEPLPAEQGGRSSGIADGEVVRVVTPMDDVALIWNLDVGDWLELACAGAGRNMTEAEWELFGPRDASHGRTCPDN